MENIKKYVIEFIGTLILVLFGCGAASIASGNILLISLSFGLTLMLLLTIFKKGQFNPAISFAMLLNKKINLKEFIIYVLMQILGGLIGSLLVALFVGSFNNLGANYVSNLLVDNYQNANLIAALLIETILSMIFVMSILLTSNNKDSAYLGGISLTICHLIGISLTGTSLNPARSLGPAILTCFASNYTPISQIWIFIIGPIVGAILGYLIYKAFKKEEN